MSNTDLLPSLLFKMNENQLALEAAIYSANAVVRRSSITVEIHPANCKWLAALGFDSADDLVIAVGDGETGALPSLPAPGSWMSLGFHHQPSRVSRRILAASRAGEIPNTRA